MTFLQVLIVSLVLMGGIFALLMLFVRSRTRKHSQIETAEKKPLNFWERVLFLLRLVGFGLTAFVLVSLAIMVFLNLDSIKTDVAPAHKEVTIPDDLPFEVEEVSFLSEDGLRMAGWYVPPENGGLVILLHGYGGTRLSMRWHAERLVEAGYGVLMYDERASGESEGTYRSYGWEDSRDVGGALSFLSDKPEVDPDKIGIAGCSIGGQIALQGAAYYPQISAVWTEGASMIRAQDIPRPTNFIAGLIVVSNYLMDQMFAARLGMKAPPPMIEIIGDIAPRPIMLVGSGIPFKFVGSEGDHLEIYARYAGENAELWVLPDAGHCGGPRARPEEYAHRMVEFFDTAFDIQRE
jgi:pimeloyl-ACP methyl ester carboxylesterase